MEVRSFRYGEPSWLYAGGETFELAAVFFVAGVVSADFLPESIRVIHVIKVGKLMQDYVIAEDFGDLHQANIERDSAIRRTTSPPGGSVAKATFVVVVAVEFGVIFKSVRQVLLGLFHEDFFLGIASALSVGIA